MCINERCSLRNITTYDHENGYCLGCNRNLESGYIEFVCKECGKVFAIGKPLAGEEGNVLGICTACANEIKERKELNKRKGLD